MVPEVRNQPMKVFLRGMSVSLKPGFSGKSGPECAVSRFLRGSFRLLRCFHCPVRGVPGGFLSYCVILLHQSVRDLRIKLKQYSLSPFLLFL